MNHYISVVLIITCILIFIYRFYQGYFYLKELDDNERSVYEEDNVSCHTESFKLLNGGSIFKSATIKLTNNYIIIKSHFVFAHHMKKKQLLLKINYSDIEYLSTENELVFGFINSEDENQEIHLYVQNRKRIEEIITSNNSKIIQTKN
jgi:hypothetical protein